MSAPALLSSHFRRDFITRSLRAAAVVLATAGFAGALHAQSAPPRVRFETTAGNFVVELNAEKAPKSVANFLKYVEDKHYDGTIFHRVVPGFVVQGGGHTRDMSEKPTRAPIENESQNGLLNDVGTIAMARTSNPNSATSQFYINLVNNRGLNYPSPDGFGYAVFGKVVEGMDVITRIASMASSGRDPARDPVTISSARLLPDSRPTKK